MLSGESVFFGVLINDNASQTIFDAVVIGGGGAGMRASLQMAQSGFKTACLSSIPYTLSHCVGKAVSHVR